jgi:hypothetical protein
MNVDDTLATRATRYGNYKEDVSRVSQALKDILRSGEVWKEMDDDMKESLDLICNKMSRIVNGDPWYHDSWHDIIVYARLVEERIEKL